jgi:formate hydrogenlyase transcriptional activator
MVAAGTFRADLYYRLAVFPIQLPRLRERVEDIRPLARWFLEKHAALMHRRPPAVSDDVWRALEAQPWPGNVRELENELQRALILSPGAELVLPDLVHRPDCAGCERCERISGAGRVAANAEGDDGEGAPGRFEDEVRLLIERALAACGGRVYGAGGAAAMLGLKPTTLQGKMKRYGVKA